DLSRSDDKQVICLCRDRERSKVAADRGNRNVPVLVGIHERYYADKRKQKSHFARSPRSLPLSLIFGMNGRISSKKFISIAILLLTLILCFDCAIGQANKK